MTALPPSDAAEKARLRTEVLKRRAAMGPDARAMASLFANAKQLKKR